MLAAESPTRTTATAASSTIAADGWSYAVTMTIGSPSARFSASLRSVMGRCSRGGEDTDGSFRVGAPAFRGRRLGVVDQAGGADGGGDDDEVAGRLEALGIDPGEVLGGDAVLGEHLAARIHAVLRRGSQGSVEDSRLGPLPFAEPYVPAAQRQAVRLPHGRHDADLEREVEVAHHPAEHRDLLRVLLAEVGAVRLDDIEQLRDDRADAREVARPPVRALEDLAEALDDYLRARAVAVDLVQPGREEHVGALLLGDPRVAALVARIGLEVARVVELRGVHEQRDDHQIGLGARGPDQRLVAGVEGAHGGDEPDAAVRGADVGAEFRDRADRLHE